MDSQPTSNELLAWSKEQTKGYRGVNIEDFSASWKDGLALCALIHSLDKNQFEYEPLLNSAKEEVLRTAFQHASNIGIPELLGAADLLVSTPDKVAVESYLLSVYHQWQQHLHRQEERMLAQKLLAQHAKDKDHGDQEVNRQISFLSERNVNVGNALRESKQTKGLLVTVEKELSEIHNTIEESAKQNEAVKHEITEKTAELENIIEKERQQYEKEIEQLERELAELKKKGPSDHQLALKQKLDEQCEKKNRLNKIKQKMEQEIQQLKLQLQQEEEQRIQLQARRAEAEQRRHDLRLKHKDELQRLQHDLFESFNAEGKLQTDLLQQNYVRNNLQAETNKLGSEVRNLDEVHTGMVKQNAELKEKKQKLEAQLLGAKLYLEEETRILNFKELSQTDLVSKKKLKTEERERSYDAKRIKEKEHRKVTSELHGTKETYDKEHRQIANIKRDVSKLEIKSDMLKSENDEEVQKRPNKLQQIKDNNRSKIDKESSKSKAKVEAVTEQTASLSANTLSSQQALLSEKGKIFELHTRTDDLLSETRSIAHSMNTEASSQREATRVNDNLKKELELANAFLVGDKHTKTKTSRAKQRAEDSIKSISEAAAQVDAKKSALENTKDHLARDFELTKQDLRLAEKEAKKAREEKQKLGEEKEKLKQDIFVEEEQIKLRQTQTSSSEAHLRTQEERELSGTIEELAKETDAILDKADVLKRVTANLADDTAALQLARTQAKIARESELLTNLQDLKTMQKLKDHRTLLKERQTKLQQTIDTYTDKAERENLQIELDFVTNRLRDVDSTIRDEINSL